MRLPRSFIERQFPDRCSIICTHIVSTAPVSFQEAQPRWPLSLDRDLSERDQGIRPMSEALDAAAEHLAPIRHAFLCRLFCVFQD